MHSVHVLAVVMEPLSLEIVIDLLRCFPCLEKLYVEVMLILIHCLTIFIYLCLKLVNLFTFLSFFSHQNQGQAICGVVNAKI
jgi:hypothetical protein